MRASVQTAVEGMVAACNRQSSDSRCAEQARRRTDLHQRSKKDSGQAAVAAAKGNGRPSICMQEVLAEDCDTRDDHLQEESRV